MRPMVLKNLLPFQLPIEPARYLLIAGLQNIPPHVAWIEWGQYFAFTVKGFDHGKDANRLIGRLISKGTPIVLVKIKATNPATNPAQYFQHLGRLIEGNSCLDPILHFFANEMKLIPERPYLHGLLEKLTHENFIESMHKSPYLPSGEFELQMYDRADIDLRIRSLRES